jgi:predicted dehydrogenase
MEGENVRILVVGVGSIGMRHIKVIAGTGEHEIAVSDINRESMDRAVKDFGIKECYIDYKEALKNNFDAAIVCTPNNWHMPVCIEAFSRGCHVLVEKPIASNYESGALMLDASKKAGKKFMVGYILRFYPGTVKVKEIIESGILGEIAFASVRLSAPETLYSARSDYRNSYETGGGIIYDYSHEIDYLRHFFGETDKLVCFKDLLVKKGKACDDVAEILIQYKNCVIAEIHMDYIRKNGSRSGRFLEIGGDKGTLEYDFVEQNIKIYNDYGTNITYNYQVERDDIMLKQFKTFINTFNSDITGYATGEDGLAVLMICDELYRSSNKNIIIKCK